MNTQYQYHLIMESQLDNICKIVKGKWFRSEIFNSSGERTSRIIIEFDAPQNSNDGE